MVSHFIAFVLRFRKLISLFMLVSTLFFCYFVTQIRVDNDTFKAIPPSLQERVDYERLRKEFASPYNILFLAQFSSGSLGEKIDSLKSWAKECSELEGIGTIADLNTVQIPVRGGFFGLQSDYLVSRKVALDDEVLRERLKENRDFSRIFISDDESVVGMIIALKWGANRSPILGRIVALTEQINRSEHIKAYITSEGAISYFIDKSMKRDFGLLLPICFLIVSFLLYRAFRKMLYVVAALTVNAVALVWTFGIIGMLNVPFSVVTSIIPVILFPIGVADAIHLLKTYSKTRGSGRNLQTALNSTYAELFTPCLLTSLTTFAGFSSFAFSQILWTRIFGIFTGIAVLFAFLFNMLLLPLFLSLEHSHKTATGTVSFEDAWLDKFWVVFSRFSLNWRAWIWTIPLLLIVFGAGFFRVNVESNPIAMLPENSMLRKSDTFIADHFGGTRFFSVVLDRRDRKLASKEEWSQIDSAVTFIEAQKGVGSVSSVLPLLSRLSTMLSKEPMSNAAVAMLISAQGIFSKSYSTVIDGWLSADRQKTRITVSCHNAPDVQTMEIASRIRLYAEKHLPGWGVLVSGPAILNEAMSTVIIKTQISSLISTFIPVLLCLMVFFRSARIGIFAIFPIVLSTAFVYALMGIFGISINLVTVIIMNTGVGIGIDYAIHFISGYLNNAKQMNDRAAALLQTLREKGTPIAINTLVVGIGFLILAFSSFPPIGHFGILVFASMIISALFAMLFLSILINIFGIGESVFRLSPQPEGK